jgi:hypothetical protein
MVNKTKYEKRKYLSHTYTAISTITVITTTDTTITIYNSNFFIIISDIESTRAAMAQSVKRLATRWTTEGSEIQSW